MTDTAPPRPLSADEQLHVRRLRHPFAEARQRVLAMLPGGQRRDEALAMLCTAESVVVEEIEFAMREGG